MMMVLVAALLLGGPVASRAAGGAGAGEARGEVRTAEGSSAAPGDRGYAVAAAAFGGWEWVTRPSKDAVMSFTITAEIAEIRAVGGQRVRAGEVMIRARDEEANAGLAVQRVRANNDAPVASAKASLDLAEVRFKRIKEADAQNAASPQEIDERRVAVDAARAALANAERQLEEERKRLVQLEEQAKRYVIEAPFDGIVEAVAMDVGQAVEPPAPVIRVVAVDPMWVDLPVPTSETMGLALKPGARAWGMLDVPGAPVLEGTVLYVSPVADAAAETRRVRVELKNPQMLPPGTRARVRFTAPPVAVGVAGAVAGSVVGGGQ
jgi:RND family efflux transporter MFP subunit